MESRYRSAWARAHAAGRLSANELLRAMVAQARNARREVWPRERRRDEVGKGSGFENCSRGTAALSRWNRRSIAGMSQRLRARNIDPTGHTRLPRYARGKAGIVVGTTGYISFPTPTPNSRVRTPARYSVRLPHESCGATRFTARLGSISTCGMTTLNAPDPTIRAERLSDLPRLPATKAALCLPSHGGAGVRDRRATLRARIFHVEGMGRDACR